MKQEPKPASQPNSSLSEKLRVSAVNWIAHHGTFTPFRLFPSRPDVRQATIISMLCVPALVLFVATTVPTLVFESPEQQAYFHFASILSRDLSSGFVMILAALCMVIALALPAARRSSIHAFR